MAEVIKMTLEAARRNAKLTQKDAATTLGVSNATLCNWENGKSFPNAQQIDQICDLYGLSYDHINFLPNNSLKADRKEK